MRQLIAFCLVCLGQVNLVLAQSPTIKLNSNDWLKEYTLEMHDVEPHEIRVRLSNRSSGQTIFDEEVHAEHFVKKYQLKYLSSGEYKLSIEYDDTSESFPISIKSRSRWMRDNIQIENSSSWIEVIALTGYLGDLNIQIFDRGNKILKEQRFESGVESSVRFFIDGEVNQSVQVKIYKNQKVIKKQMVHLHKVYNPQFADESEL